MKILIVDDDIEIRRLLKTKLTEAGYEIVTAANGSEAVEKLGTQNVDVIISDILMPVMDGFQLCWHVKSDPVHKKIPFVFYTATYKEKEDEELAFKLGASAFILKPIKPGRFVEIIKRIISDEETAATQPTTPLYDDLGVLKLYNSRLIAKLEKKTMDLENNLTVIRKIEKSLRTQKNDLDVKTRELQEANAALRALLRQRDEDKKELEDSILFNLRKLIEPIFNQLKNTRLSPPQRECLDLLEIHLNDIISPFTRRLSAEYLNLTPTELKVATHIKYGKTSKEIAQLMNLSVKTIESYRKMIRKKLGLTNRKVNLQTHLMALEK